MTLKARKAKRGRRWLEVAHYAMTQRAKTLAALRRARAGRYKPAASTNPSERP